MAHIMVYLCRICIGCGNCLCNLVQVQTRQGREVMIIFYSPDIATSHELDEEQSGHAVRVLRHKDGDELVIVDGNGNFYDTHIVNAHPKHCAVEIDNVTEENHWPYHVELAVAP